MTPVIPNPAITAARHALAAALGIASQADLARRWGLSRTRAWQLVHEPGFPEPVARVNGCDVWFIAEVEHWRQHERDLCQARAGLAGLAQQLAVCGG